MAGRITNLMREFSETVRKVSDGEERMIPALQHQLRFFVAGPGRDSSPKA